MRKVILTAMILAFATAGISTNLLIAQDNQSKDIPLQSGVADKRFSIENATFYKRLEQSNMTLNINFEVHNKTRKDLKLKVFVMAYCQVNAVDNTTRKWIPYPKWRTRDLDEEVLYNTLLDSIPAVEKGSVDSTIDDPGIYPTSQKYLQYINANPDTGNELLVKGLSSDASVSGSMKDFSLVAEPMKTTVFAKLKVPYNPENLFFNHLMIVITDQEQKKVVASRIFNFKKDFKSY